MTKAPTPKEKSKKQRDNTKNANMNMDYTTIADRLRTASNNSHPAGVVKMVYERSTFPLTATAVKSTEMMSNFSHFYMTEITCGVNFKKWKLLTCIKSLDNLFANAYYWFSNYMDVCLIHEFVM